MGRKYQMCKRCVMDTTDPNIIFDKDGNCNHCIGAIQRLNQTYFKSPKEKSDQLEVIINEIKSERGKNKYDCVIGLSGGVDSSYLALIIKNWGLNPLAIHIDNGWNSELAVQNIENIVKKLDIDLYTLVLDWEEFRDLQRSFIRASVVDLEMLSDNAIVSGIYKIAKKNKIKYFLDGVNISTESIMPDSWFYSVKVDGLNIRSIYKKHGNGLKFKTYPLLNFIEFVRYVKGDLKQISPLNYVEYNKNEAKKIIQEKFAWRDYGGKHFESRITQFYQAYLLPEKFNIDKRKAHLSSLICSGQLSKEEAMLELKKETYEGKKLLEDKDFFIKKLELTEKEFNEYISSPSISHDSYPSYLKILTKLINWKKKILWKN